MATKSEVFTNAYVLLSTTTSTGLNDVSNLVTSVELTRTYDLLDDTVMGETAHSRKAGLETVTATIEFVQVYSTDPDHVDLDTLLNTLADIGATGNSFMLRIAPKNSTVDSTNPYYQFLAVIESYTPIGGSIGEILKTTVPFQSAGGSVTRSVTSGTLL